MEATHILNLKDLGMTETESFNKNYSHSKFSEIKVTNVERNLNNKRVYFVTVTNPKVLKELKSSYNNEIIEPNHITHNRFAVYGYQLKAIKAKKSAEISKSKKEKMQFIVNYVNDGGGAIQFHALNELFLCTFDENYNKTDKITEAAHGLTSKPYDIATLDIDSIYAECLIND